MSLRLKSLKFYIRLWTYFLPSIAFAVAGTVRFAVMDPNRHPVAFDPWFYFAVLLFITMVWAFVIGQQRLCDTDELFRENTGIRRSVIAACETYAVLLAVLFFYREQNFSRIFFAISSVALLILTVGTRVVLRRLLRITRQRRRSIRVLMVGTGLRAERIASQLATIPLVTSKVVAYLRIGEESVRVHDAPVFQFDDICAGRVPAFEEVVIAASSDQLVEMDDLLKRITMLCVPMRAVIDLGSLPVVRERLFQLGDLQMLDLANTPLESPAYFLLKRSFDFCFAALMMLLFSPLLSLIALAIKLSSPGPVFFRQERVGLNGMAFQMYKFRTMRIVNTSDSDTGWTIRNDPRRTRVGTFLRKTSLDELPQFINVLKGEMSVVGPRPERPHFVRRFLDEVSLYDSRHRLRVGITGWAQVNGWRGDTSIQKRLEFDLYYLQNWSFWFDIRIMFLTAWSGMFGKNAY